MDTLGNVEFLGQLLEMNIDYYQKNAHKKIQGNLINKASTNIYKILDVCVDKSYNLVRDAESFYLVITFGDQEYLVMQPELSAPLYSSRNLALFTLTPQVKPVLQFAYQLLKDETAPDWSMYSFYLEDAVTAVDKTLKFNAIEEKQMHDNFVELLDAFNNQDEEKLIYYLKSELRMKEYGNVFGKKNYLRGQKDSLIGYVSILNEAAIRHNFPAENAYYIFNRILAKIETQEVEISFNLWLENITLYYFNEMKRYFATHNLSLAERINLYIQENIKSKLTLKELDDYFGYSERYLNKKFKEKYDITIKQYVLNQKVEVAKKMISTTNFNIKYIANNLSFKTTSHFVKVFKSLLGMTPKEYRQQISTSEKQDCLEEENTLNSVLK